MIQRIRFLFECAKHCAYFSEFLTCEKVRGNIIKRQEISALMLISLSVYSIDWFLYEGNTGT